MALPERLLTIFQTLIRRLLLLLAFIGFAGAALAAVNNAPVNTVPGALSVAEDTALAFTGANLITVADPEGTVTTTKLSVAHGTLTVSLSGGATIGAGANGSATLTLVGTNAQVNAALATLSYQPGLNYSGSDTLTLVTSNNLSSPGFRVGAQYGPVAGFSYVASPILRNDVGADKAFDGTTTESHSALFSASANNPFYFKITAPAPIVVSSYYMSGRDGNDKKPSSWTFQGSNDDNTWTVLDTQSGINLTFGTITTGTMSSFVFSNSSPFRYYRFAITASTGDYIVIGEMALVAQTTPADSDTVALTVTAVNDAPTLAAIALTGTEDTTFTFTAANFTGAYADIESTPLASITIATLPATGTLKLSGTNVTASQVITAANLANLTYEPALNENGAKTFTVTASDGALSSAAATVTVTLTAMPEAPVNTVPGALSVAEDTALAFTGANLITVADPEGTVTTTKLSVAHGTLTVSLSGGATIGAGANGSATLTLVGTNAQVNAALATLIYQPELNYSGSDTLTLVTSNNLAFPAFGMGAQYEPVAGFSYEANPTLGGGRAPEKAFDGTTTESHSALFQASASNPFYFKITAPDLKVISSYYMSGRVYNDNKPSSWTFQGSNDDNTWTVLDTQSGINLTFGTITTGTMSSFVFSNSSPFRYYRFAITASTGGYIVIGEMALVGQTTPADSDTVALTVTAVNDAPTLAAIALTGTEDITFTFTAANFTGAYADIESTPLASITIATLPATGTLKLSGTNVTASQVITAANLANLTYEPALNENGAKTFTVTASDGALSSAAATVTVTFTAMPEAPVNTVPGALSVAKDTALAFTGANLITVADPEGTVTTTKLSVAHGTLTVSLSGGATIGAGANGSATLTLVGTNAQVNAALATLIYQPELNYSGSDTLTLVTSNNLAFPAFGMGAQYEPVAGFSYEANPTLGGGRAPEKAFDGTTTESHSALFQASASNPFYFKITAPDLKVISSYYMSGRDNNDSKPSSWTFQGSNDDNTWTVLDTQSGINLTFGTITTGTMSSFVFSNSSPFRYYRFAITASTGVFIIIGEMALVGQPAPADSDTVALTVTAANTAPVVANAIPDQAGIYGNAFSYAFPANTFTDSDAGDTLTTTVSTLPAGITFDATTRTFSGTPTAPSTTTVTVMATDNFGLSVSDAFVLTIEKAPLTITADAKTKIYGAANPPLTATLTGFVNGETLGTSGVTGAASVTTTATALTGVGSATLTVAIGNLVSANYAFTTFATGALTITKAPLVVTADAKTKLYGAANPALTATISGYVNSETSTVVSGTAAVTTTATANSNVGSYAITPALGSLSATNYSFSFADGTLTVGKAPLSVTADNQTKVYGAANPTLTAAITGFQNSQTTAVLTGTPALSTTATTASGVNSYAITTALGTLASANYSFSLVDGTLAVTKAPLTVTADNKNRAYGAADPAFTATLTGFVNSDTSAVVTGAAALSSTVTPTSAAGPYPITPAIGTLTAANYAFTTFTNGTLTVGQTSQTLTLGALASKTFGDAAFSVSATSTSGLTPSYSIVSGPATISGSTVTITGAGTVVVRASQAGDGNFTAATPVDQSFTVAKQATTITWATPSAITYGTTLSAAQLNATSSLAAGTITYSPASGTTPSAGTQTLTATFTPTDTANYNTATGTVSLTVNKATPTLTWATPSAITYGTALSATQLNATSSLAAGTITYSPASGTTPSAGTQTLTATFTPTDTTNYNTATGTVSLTVNKATPTLTWATPSVITYGTALSATQLNATASAAGTITYSPASGTTPSAGTQTLTATFTPTDTVNYNTATGTVSLTVNKATSTITWATPSTITYGTALSATQLNATASVAGNFAYSPASGTTPSAGTQTLTATFTPTDTTNYNTATGTVSLTVNKATPTLTWAPPSAITYGTTLSATQLNATSSLAAGTTTYSPASGTTPSAGTQTLTATFTPTDTANYNTATGTVSLVVGKATPTITWATPSAITYGTTLSATQLNATSSLAAGSITYSPASGTTPSAGTQTLTATFTPTDTANYNTATRHGFP